MSAPRPSTLVPVLAACTGIALFAGMDAAMKGLALALGAYNAMLWRVVAGVVVGALPWAIAGAPRPTRASLRIHLLRGAVVAVMAVSFFHGITLVPLAEAIALSFIAPLLALYLAAVLLGERIGPRSIVGSLVAVGGVGVMLIARGVGDFPEGSGWGVAAVLFSAVLYAFNLILMRKQALLASPTEVAFFQNVTTGAWLMLAAPFLAVLPATAHAPAIALSALLGMCSLLLLSWAYARAEAQVLLPVEYTAFVWAAILGALFFGEAVTMATLGGTVLIVVGCLVAMSARPAPVAVAAT